MDDTRINMGAMVLAVLSRWRRIILVTLLLLAVTFAILQFVPKLYESGSELLVEPRQNAYTRASTDNGQGTPVPTEALVASQIELLKSRDTLLQVIETENLLVEPSLNGGNSTSPLKMVMQLLGRATKPARPEDVVLANLVDNLSVTQERTSALITVAFKSPDPELAARIANSIAKTHVARRAGLSLSDTAEATEWLEVEIDKMRLRVAEADDKVAAYRIDNDLFVGTNNTSLLDQQLSAIAGQITTTQERANNAKSRAALIRGLLKAGQPIDGVSDVRESAVVQRLSEEKGRLQGEKALKLATLLPGHPDIRALDAQISEIDKQITIEGRRVADALEAEAKVETDLESALRDDLTRLKVDSSTATRSSVKLNELEREAKAQRDLLENYLLRYRDAAARTDVGSALPDVRVVTLARVTRTPASPKTGLLLAAVGFAALMLQLGQIFFAELVSGRALIGPEDEQDQAHRDDVVDSPRSSKRVEPGEVAVSEPEEVLAAAPPRIAEPLSARKRGDDLAAIAEAVAHGTGRRLLVVSIGTTDAAASAGRLAGEIVDKGMSVVRVDAGRRQVTSELGLSDLCAGTANFGEVVHRTRSTDFAIVPWGQYPAANLQIGRCHTLLDALADIFEVTIVDAGGVLGPTLPALALPGWQALLVVADDADDAMVDGAKQHIWSLGIEEILIAALEPEHTRAA